MAASHRSMQFQETLSGWAFIGPLLLGFGLFFVGPLIAIFGYSLTEWNILSQRSTYVGLENYRNILFDNPEFWQVLKNSLIFAGGLVPLNVALSLALALALNRAFRGVILFRTLFFAPVVTAGAAWAIVWTFLLQKESGGINQMLALIGIEGPNWLREPNWAMVSVIITRVLKNVGLNMILYLAALQTISRDYRELRCSMAPAAGRYSAISPGRYWHPQHW